MMALAHQQVIIPMAQGVESLNVAAAAAVCLFEQRRQILGAV
jgi:TrmH family RNA methyltransferase